MGSEARTDHCYHLISHHGTWSFCFPQKVFKEGEADAPAVAAVPSGWLPALPSAPAAAGRGAQGGHGKGEVWVSPQVAVVRHLQDGEWAWRWWEGVGWHEELHFSSAHLSNLLSPTLLWTLRSPHRLQIIPSALFFFSLFSRAFSGTTFTPIQPYVALLNGKDDVSPLHPFGMGFSCTQRHTGPFAWGHGLAAPLCNTHLFPVHRIWVRSNSCTEFKSPIQVIECTPQDSTPDYFSQHQLCVPCTLRPRFRLFWKKGLKWFSTKGLAVSC